jgi:ABC-type multidrug transport system ATPase subunit
MSALISIAGLRGSIGPRGSPKVVIDEAHFERGVLHLLIGGNGFGKSTLLRMLLGFKPIYRGTITWTFEGIAPQVIDRRSRSQLLAKLYQNVGYVPQGGGDSLWPDRTVREHVYLPLSLKSWKGCRGRSRAEREKYVDSVLERALVAPAFWNRKPGSRSAQGFGASMSGGERQRVAYARAISTDPETLVLDELEAALDETSRRQFIDSVVRDYLGFAGVPKRTALVVTHDPTAWADLPNAATATVSWHFMKSPTGRITLQRQMHSERVRQASPSVIYSAHQAMVAEIATSVISREEGERWNEIGWRLSQSLLSFVDTTLTRPPLILSVAALDPTAQPGHADPVLLAATGPVGQVVDGRDAELLRQFTLPTTPPAFPEAGAFVPPTGRRVPLRTSLLSQLIRSGLGDAYKGFRVDSLKIGSLQGECFCFAAGVLAGLSDTQSYIELSRNTQSVYLFRTVAGSGSSIAVAFDFLDRAAKLDEWQRFFVLQSLAAALDRLTIPGERQQEWRSGDETQRTADGRVL